MIWLLWACDIIQPMPTDQPCQEVGFAISSRTYDCTGNPDRANARYERFISEYTCVDGDPEDTAFRNTFECALAISSLDCDQVKALGNDPLDWLLLSPTCTHVVRDANGDPYWHTGGTR